MKKIELEEIIDISRAASLQRKLKSQMKPGKAHSINGSKVEHVDTAGVQLLYAFIQTIQQGGGEVHWRGYSEKLSAAIKQLGLTQQMGL